MRENRVWSGGINYLGGCFWQKREILFGEDIREEMEKGKSFKIRASVPTNFFLFGEGGGGGGGLICDLETNLARKKKNIQKILPKTL